MVITCELLEPNNVDDGHIYIANKLCFQSELHAIMQDTFTYMSLNCFVDSAIYVQCNGKQVYISCTHIAMYA